MHLLTRSPPARCLAAVCGADAGLLGHGAQGAARLWRPGQAAPGAAGQRGAPAAAAEELGRRRRAGQPRATLDAAAAHGARARRAGGPHAPEQPLGAVVGRRPRQPLWRQPGGLLDSSSSRASSSIERSSASACTAGASGSRQGAAHTDGEHRPAHRCQPLPPRPEADSQPGRGRRPVCPPGYLI